MSETMNPQVLAAVLLTIGVLLAGLRFARLARRRVTPGGAWIAVLLVQPIAAALLYFTLFPLPVALRSDRLVIATAGTTAAQLRQHGRDAIVLAIPEAPTLVGTTRVPDLGTALRRHPHAAQLLVLGHGLPARDRDAARAQTLRFVAAPLPRGLVELQSPSRVSVGARWQVSGTVHALPAGSVELLDPSGQRADRAVIAADGRFVLYGNARAAGRALFVLRVRDAGGKLVEQLAMPLQVDAGSPLRALVLAGGPSPELKYLRRWAADAGVSLRTQISVGAGLRVGDAPVSIDAATLRDYDLLLLDERAWRELGTARKAAVRDAVRDGLGVLLRITGPLSPAERRELLALGFSVESVAAPQMVLLPATVFDLPLAGGASLSADTTQSDEALLSRADQAAPLSLSRQPLRVVAGDGVVLLHDAGGAPLAMWRGQGQGRIALWWLGDSYRLVLAGQAAGHGRLWSQTFATVARARGADRPWLRSHDPRPQQRLVVCGLGKTAIVQSPNGQRVELLVDGSGESRCAAHWPTQAGWHVVRSEDAELGFDVRAADEVQGLRAYADSEATRQLVSAVAPAGTRAEMLQPGPRLLWFLGWILAAALSWWLERRSLR